MVSEFESFHDAGAKRALSPSSNESKSKDYDTHNFNYIIKCKVPLHYLAGCPTILLLLILGYLSYIIKCK